VTLRALGGARSCGPQVADTRMFRSRGVPQPLVYHAQIGHLEDPGAEVLSQESLQPPFF
jgi:hypothetical protein